MIAKFIFAGVFVVAGVSHFCFIDAYVKIVPPILPQPRRLVEISGAVEILLGAMLLIPGLSRLAAWGLIALLIAVFPANIYMTAHRELFPRAPLWALWLRLPLQGVLITWAYRYT